MQGYDIKKNTFKTDTLYDASYLDILAEAEEGHFWFEGRKDKIRRIFQSYVSPSARILEIGGGTGFIAAHLKDYGFDIEMADIHSNALQHAKKRGIEKLYQCDLFHAPFHEEFDVVCLFDVLEHFSDPLKVMDCIKKMLKPNGMAIVTVPAHPWLWSRADVIAGHALRYTKKSLGSVFQNTQLQIVDMHYFFMSLVPLLLLRKLVARDEVFNPKVHPYANTILKLTLRSERYLDRIIPNLAGGSLLGIARKTP